MLLLLLLSFVCVVLVSLVFFSFLFVFFFIFVLFCSFFVVLPLGNKVVRESKLFHVYLTFF